MPTQESHSNRIDTGTKEWMSIHIYDSQSEVDVPSASSGILQGQSQEMSKASCHLFERAHEMRIPLPERFPRLTFFAIAVALLVSALTAEFDYLHGAGYFWP
jgi:hypothetical protein